MRSLLLLLLVFFNFSIAEMFIGGKLGASYMQTSKTDKTGEVNLDRDIENKSLSTGIEFGIIKDKYFASLSYTRNNYKDVTIKNTLINLNRYITLKNSKLKPYLGLSLGSSSINLKQTHISSNMPDIEGKTFAFGFQAGVEKSISKNIVAFAQLQSLKADHQTQLYQNSSNAQISRDFHTDLSIGLRYKF
jgi:opacity protein-like surface antigen